MIPKLGHIAIFFMICISIEMQAQIPLWQELEAEWQKNKKPEIALRLAEELIDEQTDKALFYVLIAQKDANEKFENEILLLLTEIYIRKHKDKEAEEYYKQVQKKYKEQKDTLSSKYVYIKAFWLALHSQPAEAAEYLKAYLEHINPEQVDEKSMAVLFLEYATNLMRIRNYEGSLKVLDQAEGIFKRLKIYKHLGRVYNLRGLIYKNTFYYTLAIESFIKAIKTYKSHNPVSRNLAVSYVNLGNIYIIRPKDTAYYKEAEKMYKEGVNICLGIKDTVQLIHFYERLGSLSLARKQAYIAEKYYQQGFELAQKIGSSHLKGFLRIRIASAYDKDGQSQKAIELLEKVLEDMEKDRNLEMTIDATQVLAIIYQDLGEHKKALEYLEKGIFIAEKGNIKLFQMMFFHHQVRSLIALKDLEKAKEKNEKIKPLAKGDRGWYLRIYHNQKLIDSVRGDYKAAFIWAGKYQNLKDSLDNVEKIQSFNEVQQRFLAEEKESENQVLRLQNEQEKANNQRNTYFILALGLLSLLLLFVASNWWLKQKKLRIINKQIVSQEQQLREYAGKLSANNEILGKKNEFDSKLLAIISHDLRGPIHSVSTLLDMMKKGMFKPDEMPGLLELAHSSLFGAGQLLDNLLFWAKSYQSDFRTVIKEINVKQIANEIVGLLALQAEQKGIYLENHIQSDVTCLAEEEAVQLTIRNLVSNAIKFTKEGGVALEATCTTTHCKIIIKDTGVGISSENIKKIFEKSFHTKGTSKEKGNGLGLMLCKEFIERNKGTISVSSQIGVGSIFTITLPKGKLQEKNQIELPEQSLV